MKSLEVRWWAMGGSNPLPLRCQCNGSFYLTFCLFLINQFIPHNSLYVKGFFLLPILCFNFSRVAIICQSLKNIRNFKIGYGYNEHIASQILWSIFTLQFTWTFWIYKSIITIISCLYCKSNNQVHCNYIWYRICYYN